MTPVTISRRKLLIAGSVSLLGLPAFGQDKYPSKAIRMVVPHPVGGGVDIIARNLGEHMRAALGQPIVVENKPGANGMIGAQFTATAPADGYTLMMNGPGEIAIAPHLVKNMTYDPFRDLQPITLCSRAPNVLVVGPSTPANNVAELIALAKSKPLTFGSSGIGNIQHLNGELFNKLAGVKIEHVPYKGAAPQIADIVAGQINMGYMSVAAAISAHPRRPLAAARGRPRASACRRCPTCPRWPKRRRWRATSSTTGSACSRPPVCRGPSCRRCTRRRPRAWPRPRCASRSSTAARVPAPTTPEEFAAFIAGESKMFAQIIKEANVTAS